MRLADLALDFYTGFLPIGYDGWDVVVPKDDDWRVHTIEDYFLGLIQADECQVFDGESFTDIATTDLFYENGITLLRGGTYLVFRDDTYLLLRNPRPENVILRNAVIKDKMSWKPAFINHTGFISTKEIDGVPVHIIEKDNAHYIVRQKSGFTHIVLTKHTSLENAEICVNSKYLASLIHRPEPVRDTQRKRCYDFEHQLRILYPQLLTPITTEDVLHYAKPRIGVMPTIEVGDTGGPSYYSPKKHHIFLGQPYACMMIHEVAHAVAGDMPAHGKKFMRALLNMYAEYLGVEITILEILASKQKLSF